MMEGIRLSRVWAMPNKHTFLVPPLLEIIGRYRQPEQLWLDPFAGFHSPVPVCYQNDLNTETPALYHEEAADFIMQMLEGVGAVDGVLFDPPYSLTQVSRSYKDIGLAFKGGENPTGGFPKVRDAIAAILKPEGVCISYGWNTVGIGVKRGFYPVEYLICSHGGNRNDTLVTVERKSLFAPLTGEPR